MATPALARAMAEPARSGGTATYLLTGFDRSSPLWEQAPEAAAGSVAQYRHLVRTVGYAHGATGLWTDQDDGVLVEFVLVADAVAAAVAIQQASAEEVWVEGLAVVIRMGICVAPRARGTGSDLPADPARRCARLRDVAHPHQIVMSADSAALLADEPLPATRLVDLGTHRLRDLSAPETIVELRTGSGTFPQPLTLDVLPNNLPTQVTSFVGRGRELVELRRLLGRRRLVTLTGSGGCGKTRLAAHTAAAVADRWPDGVWWVDLGSTVDPGRVPGLAATILRVLVDPSGDPLRALVSQVERKRLLVCLDTCEHVLDAAAELADALLRDCPQVSILTTSREPLGVAGESVYRVPPLDADQSAVLFGERAALLRPEFTVAAAGSAVFDICQRVDGLPLAIELAAAWVPTLTPVQIADRLDDRFRLLTGGPRGAIGRHQTLRACIEWSHDLLSDGDRVVFRRLAVFAGGFTFDAVAAVCAQNDIEGDLLVAIRRLVDKSLVVVDEGDGGVRYRLLDTIRQYAEDQLRDQGEMATVRDAHLDFFLAIAEAAEPELEREQDTWRVALETEHANLRSALLWGLAAPDPLRARRLAAALARFWFLHGHTEEGRGLLNQAIELAPDDRSRLQARLLCGAAMVAMGTGRPMQAGEAAARALPVAVDSGDDLCRARNLTILAYGRMFDDFAASHEFTAEARRYADRSGDPMAKDIAMVIDAILLAIEDRHDDSGQLARQVYERALPRGERFCAAFARVAQLTTALFTGDVRRAEELAAEAVRLAEPLGDYFAVGHTIANLAWVKSMAGDLDGGMELMAPVARTLEAAWPDVRISMLELAMGRLYLAGGDLEGAVKWFEQGTRYAESATDNLVVANALPGLAAALRRLGRHDEARALADRATALARTLNMPNLLAQALEEQGFLATDADPERSEALHHQALGIRVEHGLRTVYVDSLEALAGLTSRTENAIRAVRLLAACEVARDSMGYPRPPVNRQEHDDLRTALRDQLGDSGFGAAWAEGAELSLEDAVAYATRARGTRNRPSTGWTSLTPTEQEVVRLAVEGLTNPEIGARLFISRATVKAHLSRVYAKLGVSNRTELARHASSRPDGI